MSNDYRNVFHRAVLDIEPGKQGELELTAAEESEYLRQGKLEIVPRPYKVVGPHVVYEAAPGDVFLAALQVEQEQHLVAAGHIERAPRTEKRQKEAAKALKESDADKGN